MANTSYRWQRQCRLHNIFGNLSIFQPCGRHGQPTQTSLTRHQVGGFGSLWIEILLKVSRGSNWRFLVLKVGSLKVVCSWRFWEPARSRSSMPNLLSYNKIFNDHSEKNNQDHAVTQDCQSSRQWLMLAFEADRELVSASS